MRIPRPGCDGIMLTTPDGTALCNSLACARAGRAAEVVVTYGTLNDPGASLYSAKHCGVSPGGSAAGRKRRGCAAATRSGS